MKSVQEYSMNFNSRIKVNFNGGDLTSDAGLLLYKEFDYKLGLSETVEKMLVVDDPVMHRDHPNSDVVIQKLYQHLAGYHADDHADDLSEEPLLTAILGKSAWPRSQQSPGSMKKRILQLQNHWNILMKSYKSEYICLNPKTSLLWILILPALLLTVINMEQTSILIIKSGGFTLYFVLMD
nr:transposase [Zhaonella formicivorans]